MTGSLEDPLLDSWTTPAKFVPPRQSSSPVSSTSRKQLPPLKRQTSAPAKVAAGLEDLDPRVQELCRHISEGTTRIELPFGPAIPLGTITETPFCVGDARETSEGDVPFPSEGLQTIEEDEPSVVRCLLSPRDELPVLIVCCFMSLAQGCSMCQFFGVSGYFSNAMAMPQLILYLTIVQAVLTPPVLELQRRYDHIFDSRFGHGTTFLFRIVGLSVVQVLLQLVVPFATSPLLFLVLAGVSAMVTVMVFAQVCMVVACVEGAQAVNFVRTSCHAGGVVTLVLTKVLNVSSQSNDAVVLIFFACGAMLQFLAVLLWCYEHYKNVSLAAAYAVIRSQQYYSATKASGDRANEEEKAGGYTWATMFGNNVPSGVALLCSFSANWMAWSFTMAILNMFGDADLAQSLKLLTYPADTLGRLISHFLHSFLSEYVGYAPSQIFHGLTLTSATITLLLVSDIFIKFLDPQVLRIVIFGLCLLVTFTFNELLVKVMQVASNRTQVAHFQNMIFFSVTMVSTIGALIFELAYGPV